MGKRSSFERVARDYYPTPAEAVLPLIPHLTGIKTFCEPCAGDGRLVRHLEAHGLQCVTAVDIEPRAPWVEAGDAMALPAHVPFLWSDAIITNPPWDRKFLHPFIEHFAPCGPVWLLFDADWIHTKQSARFLPYLHQVVSVGRVKWIEGSKQTGKDNCAWYRFGARKNDLSFTMHGRQIAA